MGRIEVCWDGTRAYRVPSTAAIDAITALSEGLTVRLATRKLFLSDNGFQTRINRVRYCMGAKSAPQALYQMYRLDIVKAPRIDRLSPILDDRQRQLLRLSLCEGKTYQEMYDLVGLSISQIQHHLTEMTQVLGANHRLHALVKAVERGDIEVECPEQLWRGVI